MNNDLFQQARFAYTNKNYEEALAVFTQCLQDQSYPLAPGELGLIYHQIGNCLVKLKDYGEAIHAYTQATADGAYDASGTVSYNLGMAYASLLDYDNAVRYFEIAVSDAKYDTPYKAYLGMGNALLKLGKSAEAGVSFRSAALDENNPDPTKALLNLGVCFMTLDRPQDAVASYESAIPFKMSDVTKNKLFANLGQAYVAAGQMQQAVTAFETALADKTYLLSDSASVDYQRAVAAVAAGEAEKLAAPPVAAMPPAAATAAMAPLDADMSGLDVSADGTPVYPAEDPYYAQDPYYPPEDYGMQDAYASGDDRFFNASDEELEQWSKGLAKQSRRHRNVGLKIFLVFAVILLLLFGGAVFAYTQGYGFPSQQTVVEELFADPSASSQNLFAEGLTDAEVASMTSQLPSGSEITINGINKSMSESTAYVTARTSEGAEVQYEVNMVRDMFGWKIVNAEIFFSSQQ